MILPAASRNIAGSAARGAFSRKLMTPAAAVGPADQHEAAAADIAAARVDHGQRIADRDRRIDGIAAGLQDAPPDLAGLVLRRDDHGTRASAGSAADAMPGENRERQAMRRPCEVELIHAPAQIRQ